MFISLVKLGNNFAHVLSKWGGGGGDYWKFDKTQVKLFPNFMTMLFDYLFYHG